MGRRLLLLAVALCAACAAGCDTGGLLTVEQTLDGGTDGGIPVVLGPSAHEFVNSGTVASNSKYKLVFTLGQGTPNQSPETGQSGTLNGGIVGATQ